MRHAWGAAAAAVLAGFALVGCSGSTGDGSSADSQRPSDSHQRFTGQANCSGQRETELPPEADLVDVTVIGTNSGLKVTWTVAGSIPDDGPLRSDQTRAFYLNASSGDDDASYRSYQMGVKWVGADRFQFAADMTGRQINLDPDAVVSGGSVTATFPTYSIIDLASPFSWDGAATLDGEDIDGCPMAPHMDPGPQVRTPFPRA